MAVDLFDVAAREAEAKAAKAAGMQQAEHNVTEAWSKLMFDLVRIVALEVPTFTADDVIDRYEAGGYSLTTHDFRAFGPVMARATKAGFCKKTDRVVPCRRKSRHASPIAIWQSLIFKGK